MRMCAIYLKSDYYYVMTLSKTKEGFWVVSPPFEKLCFGIEKSLLGQVILEALDKSRLKIKRPIDYKKLIKPILSLAGERSWNDFVRDCRYLEVTLQGNILTFVPMRPDSDYGFLEVKNLDMDLTLKVYNNNLERTFSLLVCILQQAMDLCE